MRASLPIGLLTLLAALAVVTGCSSQTVMRDAALPKGGEPAPTLLAAYQVELIRTESGGGLAMTGGQVAAFGATAIEPLTEAMAAEGFDLQFDADPAKVLDRRAVMRPSNKLTTLTGLWTHPETSAYRFDYTTRGSDGDVAKLLAAEDAGRPYFASITLFIDEERALPLDRAPLIKVSIRVIDREGNAAYYARTEGAGRRVAISADRSMANLLLGLQAALEKLKTLTATDI